MTRRCIYGLMAVMMLAGCNKAPDGVISEKVMARLIADLNKAETYLDTHNDEFPTDSAKMALKQSIFAKHGVDQELYDHSLGWYARNMDVYADVCDRALRQLEDEQAALTKRQSNEPQQSPAQAGGHRKYANHGDTADVWPGQRAWMLTAGMRQGTIRWDIEPDNEKQPGDKYQLQVRITGNARDMTATLAADYGDGSTTSITRPLTSADWNTVDLQTDTTQDLRRIYGYIRYKMQPTTLVLVDSVTLLRTHLDRNAYGLMDAQTTVSRRNDSPTPKATQLPDAQSMRDSADARTRGRFSPKPGVNKSSHNRHIANSPNATHLPH